VNAEPVTAAHPPSASAAPRAASRWLALDALRGLTIAGMILVNNPGDWGHVYAPLRHAAWHGCTFADLVFPSFLFAVGVAIVPALGRARERGASLRELLPRVTRRALLLIAIGIFLAAFPLVTFVEGRALFAPLLEVRFPGVLQRIGVCYALAAGLFLTTSARTQMLVLTSCLLIYWPLLGLCPTPDGGAPDWNSKGDHLAGWLDRTIFGNHVWSSTRGFYDPEGLLSTIGALATTLLGVAMGRVLASTRTTAEKVQLLLTRGALLMATGAVWGWLFPINKPLWTSSYSLWTGGIATSGLGLFLLASESPRGARWLRPLQIYGVNALLVFVGSALLARTIGRLISVTGADGKSLSLQQALYRGVFAPLGEPYLASLAYALAWVLMWFGILWLLWRRGIVWKV
jgi:predicted acyltransferase